MVWGFLRLSVSYIEGWSWRRECVGRERNGIKEMGFRGKDEGLDRPTRNVY